MWEQSESLGTTTPFSVPHDPALPAHATGLNPMDVSASDPMFALVRPWLALCEGSTAPQQEKAPGGPAAPHGQPTAQPLLRTAPPHALEALLADLRKALHVSKTLRAKAEERLPYVLAAARDAHVTSPPQLAYMLATAEHESGMGSNMDEDYNGHDPGTYFEHKYGPGASPAKRLGNTHKGDGAKYFGRGFVQLTGRRNYTMWTERLKNEGFLLDGKEVDLVNHAELAMRPELAAKIMAEGMRDGTFTGRRLGKDINDKHVDFHSARRVINGTDRADRIAARAEEFLGILKRHPDALLQLGKSGMTGHGAGAGTAPHAAATGEEAEERLAERGMFRVGAQQARQFLKGSHDRLRGLAKGVWRRLPETAKNALRATGEAVAGGLTRTAGALSSTARMLRDRVTPTAESTEGGAENIDDLANLFRNEHLTAEQISRARELIAHQPAELQGGLYQELQAKVPYHNQRNNQSTEQGKGIGDKMCNLTSLAMALETLGIGNPEPDKHPQFEDYLESLRVKNKLPRRTERDGWGGVARAMGANVHILGEAGTRKRSWWEAQAQPKLRSGYAVMMSITGHIVRLQDVTTSGLVVDDPYGSVKLKKGTGHSWKEGTAAANRKTDPGSSETAGAHGEDAVWPWADVEQHSMLWVAALNRR